MLSQGFQTAHLDYTLWPHCCKGWTTEFAACTPWTFSIVLMTPTSCTGAPVFNTQFWLLTLVSCETRALVVAMAQVTVYPPMTWETCIEFLHSSFRFSLAVAIWGHELWKIATSLPLWSHFFWTNSLCQLFDFTMK